MRATFGFNAAFNADGRLWKNATGGGGILDVGCYPVSLARLVAGVAAGQGFADPIAVSGAGQLNAVTGVDEYAAGTLKFASGIVAQIATAITLQLEKRGAYLRLRGRSFHSHALDSGTRWRDGEDDFDQARPGTARGGRGDQGAVVFVRGGRWWPCIWTAARLRRRP